MTIPDSLLKPLAYVAFVIFLIDLLFAYGMYDKWANPLTLTPHATRPDFLLINTRLYLEEDYERSITSLRNALEVLRQLRNEADEESKTLMDPAYAELKGIYLGMSNAAPEAARLNNACIEMLLSLTFLQVKTAESYLQKGDLERTKKSLRFAMLHVKHALLFSKGAKKYHEVTIYSEMDAIVKDPHLTPDHIDEKLKWVMEHIRNLEGPLGH